MAEVWSFAQIQIDSSLSPTGSDALIFSKFCIAYFLLTYISVRVFLLELLPHTQGGELICRDESCWVSLQTKSQKFLAFFFKVLQNYLWVHFILWGRLCDCRINSSCNSFVKGAESPSLTQLHHRYFSA